MSLFKTLYKHNSRYFINFIPKAVYQCYIFLYNTIPVISSFFSSDAFRRTRRHPQAVHHVTVDLPESQTDINTVQSRR